MTRWSRMFAGRPESVGAAREFARAVLEGHPLLDDVELVASELCTNAIEHTDTALPGGHFVLEVDADGDGVRVGVVDEGGDDEPVPSSSDPAAEAVCGRGLFLVEALAEKWGAEPVRVGRRVWAQLVPGS